MGYEMQYGLTPIRGGDDRIDYEEEMSKIIEKTEGDIGFNPFAESTTWYEHEKHMLLLSEKFPEVVFQLYAAGGVEDIWIKYFHNGKMQRAKTTITFEEFNENKLK